ncbi:complement component C8 gamma chain isoform X2 [Nycticebus coucang]|uniref:complement component C8 gamma chain isoform X2 n=1 Tax=Nycticebus coucang TaxID=9470 RepID=UPI00234CCF82|nr:complement component C8 gamma chain isoform X2 [Nycticebus coucang]
MSKGVLGDMDKKQVNLDFVHRTWCPALPGRASHARLLRRMEGTLDQDRNRGSQDRCRLPGLGFWQLWTVDSDPSIQPSASPSAAATATATMLPSGTVLLLALLLATTLLSQGARRPSRPPSPISTIQPQASFDAQQFAGTWFLVAVGSACRFLQEQGHRAEATTLRVAPQGTAMTVSTFRKLDGICWQVRQLYADTGVPGRFLLQARGARGATHVVIAETDYQNFAILYLEQAGQLSVKLYGAWWLLSAFLQEPWWLLGEPRTPVPLTARSLPVSNSALSGFERRVQEAHLTEDQVFFFPKYGFCEAADQFHVLDEARR